MSTRGDKWLSTNAYRLYHCEGAYRLEQDIREIIKRGTSKKIRSVCGRMWSLERARGMMMGQCAVEVGWWT